jgi:hypothetical protein
MLVLLFILLSAATAVILCLVIGGGGPLFLSLFVEEVLPRFLSTEAGRVFKP